MNFALKSSLVAVSGYGGDLLMDLLIEKRSLENRRLKMFPLPDRQSVEILPTIWVKLVSKNEKHLNNSKALHNPVPPSGLKGSNSCARPALISLQWHSLQSLPYRIWIILTNLPPLPQHRLSQRNQCNESEPAGHQRTPQQFEKHSRYVYPPSKWFTDFGRLRVVNLIASMPSESFCRRSCTVVTTDRYLPGLTRIVSIFLCLLCVFSRTRSSIQTTGPDIGKLISRFLCLNLFLGFVENSSLKFLPKLSTKNSVLDFW